MKVYEYNPETGVRKIYMFPIVLGIGAGVVLGKSIHMLCVAIADKAADKLEDWAKKRREAKSKENTDTETA